MKKLKYVMLAAVAVILSVCFVACDTSGTGGTAAPFGTDGLTDWANPGDNLGGAGTGTAEEDTNTSTISAEVTAVTDAITETDFQTATDYDESTATEIVLDGTSQTVTVTGNGTYVVSGALSEGQLIFKNGGSEDYDVHIVLNGVSITSGASAPLCVFDGLNAVITLNEGTVNTLTDGTTHTVYYKKSGKVSTSADDDKVSACLYVQNDLTINGTGTLTVNGNYNNAIYAKDNLTLLSGTVNATANTDGTAIKGKESVVIKGGTVTAVSTVGDGIKSDVEADTKTSGYVYIASATVTVTAGDDGICADTLLVIDSGMINITTNGGAPSSLSQITETSSDNVDGKALKVGAIEYEDGDGVTQEITDASYYKLVINGGTITLNSNDDAVHSNGYLYITGGTINIATGDDGVHADEYLKISGGTVNVLRCYEGIEAAQITISGGDVSVVASDDGINAANGDYPTGYDFKMVISGGTIKVNAYGDGVDSNGSITVTGGALYIDGPTDGGNGSLDSEKGIVVSGGTLVAVGSLGMVETPTANSTQCVVSYAVNSAVTAGSTITLKDADGNVILEFTTAKSCQSIIISDDAIVNGGTYSLYIGSTLAKTFTVSSTVTSIGTATGGGTMGGKPGGDWGFGRR